MRDLPSGALAPIRTEPSGQRRASFAKAMCVGCPLRDRCLAPARGVRQVLIAPDEELLVAARQALNDPAQAEHLRRTRPRIERLLGLLAVRYGAGKSRYFGTAKARLQATWAAALVNLNPIGTASPPRPPDRRPTRRSPPARPADRDPARRAPPSTPRNRANTSSGTF